MKVLSRIFAFCIMLLCLVPRAQSIANPHLDIILEGPWVLYEERTFSGMSVLVAIAPYESSRGGHSFHYPLISAGDGNAIAKAGISCLLFDNKCGMPGNVPLTSDDYPGALPLNVKISAQWKWASLGSKNIVLLLPMPDSYSNEETWPMRFGPKYDAAGNGYGRYGGDVHYNHSIGFQLHYVNGPNYIDIGKCNFGGTPMPSDCTATSGNHRLSNTGTLRVVMKAPDPAWLEADYCDFHVRYTYPLMLSLVDGNNDQIKVIDPAMGVDANGDGVYDNGKDVCLDNDDQQYNPVMAANSMSRPAINEQITGILSHLNNISHNSEVQALDDKKTANKIAAETSQIEAARKNLSDELPRISQLTIIRYLIKKTSRRIDVLSYQLEKKRNDKRTVVRKGSSSFKPEDSQQMEITIFSALKVVEGEMTEYLATTPSKDGKDCRAPLMLAGP